MIEKSILKLFMSNREVYETYSKHLDLSYIKTNFGVLYKLFNVIKLIYLEENKKTCSVEELEGQYIASYPMLKEVDRKELSIVLESVEQATTGDSVVALLEAHKVRAVASQAALVALDVAEGKKSKEDLLAVIESLGNTELEDAEEKDSPKTLSLMELEESGELEKGLQWRLTGLQKAAGPIRRGDLIHIFADRESGKTACWINESMHMAKQLKDDETLDIFFNEENWEAVLYRMYSNLIGWDTKQIMGNKKRATEEFEKIIPKGRIRFYDSESLSAKFIEDKVLKGNTKLIVIDNMDKVKGFEGERRDQELHNAYKWARSLAKKVCPIITIGQADASASNRQYISCAQMADGKVGKPSEIDLAIGIGRIEESQHPFERYFYLSRNKLRGDENTIENMRHARFSAILEPQYSRYVDGGVNAIR